MSTPINRDSCTRAERDATIRPWRCRHRSRFLSAIASYPKGVFCLADRSDKFESLSSGERFSVVDEDAVHGLPVLRGDHYHREMTFDPKTLGLVLIEYQNDFTTEGGVLHDAVSAVMEKTRMLEHTRNVAAAARRAGATVMHAPIAFAEGYVEISDTPYGILKGVVDGGAFVKGSWGAAIFDDLTPVEGDIVIEGKRGLDTFASTNLDFILRSKGITTIALGGFLTNCCVESTMRTGYECGYRVITLTDCVAGTSIEEHDNAIKFDYPMFSQPMTAAEFIDALTQ